MLIVLRTLCILVSLLIMGCGAAPGGDTLDGANGDLGLPLSGVAQEIRTSWGLFKDGSYSASKAAFETALAADGTVAEKSEIRAGLGWCHVKLSGSQAGIDQFRQALQLNTNQNDARVGLAGALISKGSKEDIQEAITLLEGLDAGNANFVYNDVNKVGVSNAEAHAMLAYAYFVQGNRTKSNEQIRIASDLDSQFSGTPVDQIAEVLKFIP